MKDDKLRAASGVKTMQTESTINPGIWQGRYEVTASGEQYLPTSKYNLSFSQFSKSTESAYYLGCAFLHNDERPKDAAQDATRETRPPTGSTP